MKHIIPFTFMLMCLSSCHSGKTDTTEATDSITESSDTSVTPRTVSSVSDSQQPSVADSTHSTHAITEDMAYEGVNNYCHKEYDWSVAEDNPSIMYVEKGEETDTEYQIIFRSYTGSFVYFYVNKSTGITRMVEHVPALNITEESGTINLSDYLE